jgi:primosomal protein N' (replication factor Y)
MLPAGINYKLTTVYGAKAEKYFSIDLSDAEFQRIYDFLRRKRNAVKSEIILDAFGLSDTSILDKMVSEGFLYKSDEAFRRTSDAVTKMVAPTENGEMLEVKLTAKQQGVMDLLNMVGGTSVKEICYFTGVTSGVLDTLHKKGLVYFYDEEIFRIENRGCDKNIAPLCLSNEQTKACDNLYREYLDDKPHTSLLYGVTGSGKTSVFISLIERVINDDRGIIVMVPEISLTPQFVDNFSKRFGDKIAVFHSALSLGERLDEYKRVRKGLA